MNKCDEVAYIESTGLEYIDTGYIPTVDTYTKTKFMITNTNPTTQFVFGSKNSTYSWEGYAVLTYGTPTFWFDYGNYDQQTSYNVTTNTLYEIEYYKGHGTINGETKLSERIITYNFNHSLYVLAVNGAGTMVYSAKMRLYSMQIKDSYNGNLIRDFIPCYQKIQIKLDYIIKLIMNFTKIKVQELSFQQLYHKNKIKIQS